MASHRLPAWPCAVPATELKPVCSYRGVALSLGGPPVHEGEGDDDGGRDGKDAFGRYAESEKID